MTWVIAVGRLAILEIDRIDAVIFFWLPEIDGIKRVGNRWSYVI